MFRLLHQAEPAGESLRQDVPRDFPSQEKRNPKKLGFHAGFLICKKVKKMQIQIFLKLFFHFPKETKNGSSQLNDS